MVPNMDAEMIETFLSELEQTLQCSICLDIQIQPTLVSPCMHSFCSRCISRSYKISQTCPMCREKITESRKNLVMAAQVDSFLKFRPRYISPRLVLDTNVSNNVENQQPAGLSHPSPILFQLGESNESLLEDFNSMLIAIENNELHLLENLLRRYRNHALLNRTEGEKCCLFVACDLNHVECAALLCNYGANKDLRDNDGVTALITASLKGHSNIVQLLCENGADMDISCHRYGTALIAASTHNQPECIEILCNYNANLNTEGADQQTALIAACHRNHVACVRILCERGALVDKQDANGDTAVNIACWNGFDECLEVLCQHNANITYSNHEAISPLIAASYNNHCSCIKILCQQTNIGAIINQRNNEFATALMASSYNGCTECVRILGNSGADVRMVHPGNKWNALMYASFHGHTGCVDFLCEKEALLIPNTNESIRYETSALILACKQGHAECAKILCNYNVDVNFQDKDGGTALTNAVCFNKRDCVEILLQHPNINKELRDSEGRTAWMLANRFGDKDIVALF